MKPTAPTSTSDFQLSWWRQRAIVYFIAAGNPPIAIKIGVTQWQSAKKRIGACQTGNHEALRLIGIHRFIEGDFPLKSAEDKERELHHIFRKWQRFPEGTRGHEWFTASEELIDYIRSHADQPTEHGFTTYVSEMTGPKK